MSFEDAAVDTPHLAVAIGVSDANELIDLVLCVEELLQEDLYDKGERQQACWQRNLEVCRAVVATVSSSLLQIPSAFRSMD